MLDTAARPLSSPAGHPLAEALAARSRYRPPHADFSPQEPKKRRQSSMSDHDGSELQDDEPVYDSITPAARRNTMRMRRLA
jgi:hypothetical protein